MSTDEQTAEYQDLSDVDEVWLGDQAVAGEEFVEALDAVRDFQESIRTLKAELSDLRIGLDREDAVRLIYARNAEMTLGQVEAGFEVIDAFVDEDIGDVAPRILADQTTELTIAEAAEVWSDMVALAEKYGSLNDQTEDDQ